MIDFNARGPRNSPFAVYAARLIAAGYSPLPITLGDKSPAIRKASGWIDPEPGEERLGWTAASREVMPEGELLRHVVSDYGLGVACGYGGLVAVDVDTDDEEKIAAIRSVLDASPVAKRGKKGRTDFYRDPLGLVGSASFKGIMDILATDRQSVLPPTIHKDTGQPYVSLTELALWDVRPEDLPIITSEHVARLMKVLEPFGPPKKAKAASHPHAAAAPSAPASDTRMAAYARKTIDERCADLAVQTEPGRNEALKVAACYLGKFVHHRFVTRDELVARLLDTCRTNGLLRDDGERTCLAPIEYGLNKSLGDPLPELEDRPPASHQHAQQQAPRGMDVAAIEAGPPLAPQEGLALITQDVVAQAFVDKAAGRLRYCHSHGAWFVWTDFFWRQDATDQAFHYARLVARKQMAQHVRKRDEKKAISRASFAAGVERYGRADPACAVSFEFWDRDPWLLGTPSGTVDLRTGVLRAPDAADGITKITAVAPAASADCPRFIKFLNEATGNDQELETFLQQICGYCLTGMVREHLLLFIYGGGGTGKSTFLRVLTDILNQYAVPAPMTALTAAPYDGHPTEVAMMRGARLVSAVETEDGQGWAEARIKRLTGGEAVPARFMRQDFFSFIPQFKLLVVGNHAPRLRNVDEAIRRRMRVIPFRITPATVDRQLGEALRGEYPAILRWMIAGCLDWQRNSLTTPKCVALETEKYLSEQTAMSEAFAKWVDAHCVLEPDNSAISGTTIELFNDWRDFASLQGEDAGSKNKFGRNMRKLQAQDDNTGKVRLWRGIRLKTPREKGV